MARSKYPDDDLFSRAELLRQRHPEDMRRIRLEADASTGDNLLQALVTAAAVISYADGRMDIAERRRLIEAFSTSATLEGFSVTDLAEELAHHMRAYAYDPISAEAEALTCLGLIALSAAEKELVGTMCDRVLTADGMVHPAELGALSRVKKALGIHEARS